MEFVDGLTLRQLLQTRRLAPEEALAIVPRSAGRCSSPTNVASCIAISSRRILLGTGSVEDRGLWHREDSWVGRRGSGIDRVKRAWVLHDTAKCRSRLRSRRR